MRTAKADVMCSVCAFAAPSDTLTRVAARRRSFARFEPTGRETRPGVSTGRSLCRPVGATSFKLTKKNVDARTHATSKHPEKTFDQCFPAVIAHEAELAAGGGDGGGGGAKGGVGKKGGKAKKDEDPMALLSEGLAGASVGKKAGKKK